MNFMVKNCMQDFLREFFDTRSLKIICCTCHMACGDESERKQSHPMVFLANEVLQTEIRVSVLGLQAKSHVEQYQTCIAGMLYFFLW